MEKYDTIVLCSFDTFQDDVNDSAIAQQKRLYESLDRNKLHNEILFNHFVGVYHHDRRLKPKYPYEQHFESIEEIPSIPSVVFINLANNGKRIESEISYLNKRK